MTEYGDSLAAVGLYPDNPDGMYSNLMSFLKDPVKFKNADPHWGGARDDLTWYEDPKGTAAIEWPFGGGKWADAMPMNDAQIRAIYKIPPTQTTANFLLALYKMPRIMPVRFAKMVPDKGGFDLGHVMSDIGGALSSAANAFLSVANTLHIPMVNITAALLTGKDPIQALKEDLSSFMQAGAIAKGVVSGDLTPLAQQATNAAASFGVHLDPTQVAQVASAAQSGDPAQAAAAAMGPDYVTAWNAATEHGTVYDPHLPPPPGFSYAPNAVQNPNPSAPVGTPGITIAFAKGFQKLKDSIGKALPVTPAPKAASPAPAAKAPAAPPPPKAAAPSAPAKKSLVPFLTAASGAGVGAVVGGPIGAAVGGAIGFAGGVLASIVKKGPKS